MSAPDFPRPMGVRCACGSADHAPGSCGYCKAAVAEHLARQPKAEVCACGDAYLPPATCCEPAGCSVPGCATESSADCPCKRSRLCSWHAIGARLSDGCVCRGPCTYPDCTFYARSHCEACDAPRCREHLHDTLAYGSEVTACVGGCAS